MRQKPAQAAAGAPSSASRWVAYYRVSTDQQGRSGLGLEAQREAVGRHVATSGGVIVAEFQEIESGKRNDRPQIAAALAACRAQRATLIIAKLDRLARNVAFISGLMESGVDFVAADMPMANRLTVHILAAVAEHEREMISARTKAALAVVKAECDAGRGWVSRRSGNRIVRLGSPVATRERGTVAATLARKRQARRRAADAAPYIEAARRAGCATLSEIGEALTARGVRTPAGGAEWRPEQVRRALARIEQSGGIAHAHSSRSNPQQ